MNRRKRIILTSFVLLISVFVWLTYRLVEEAIHTSSLDVVLIGAIDNGDKQQVKDLLKLGVNPNSEFRGNTPLREAGKKGNADIIRLLKQAGAKE